jgi:hypothetical protein
MDRGGRCPRRPELSGGAVHRRFRPRPAGRGRRTVDLVDLGKLVERELEHGGHHSGRHDPDDADDRPIRRVTLNASLTV